MKRYLTITIFWKQKSIFDNFVIYNPYPSGSWKVNYIMFYLCKTCKHVYKNNIPCDNFQMITGSQYCKQCDDRQCTYMFILSKIRCSNICDDTGTKYCNTCKLRNCNYVFKYGRYAGDKCEKVIFSLKKIGFLRL
jgi:hypothetical protein